MNKGFGKDDITIDGAYQFDISEEAFDTQNLFAVCVPRYQLRGLIIDRYVLRVGFPDFPQCPAGTAFTMLGFDEQAKQYVWLATGIHIPDTLEHPAQSENITASSWSTKWYSVEHQW
jgi:hypothetical protein